MHLAARLVNYEKVQHGMYIVRTQAGFRKALREFWGSDPEEKQRPSSFPKSYPALVVFSNEYRGYHYVECNVIHLNDLKKVLEKHV